MSARPAQRFRRISRFALCFASLVGVACDDLDQFRTDAGEIFRGPVVGNEATDAGTVMDQRRSYLLYGFDAATVMELEFDPALVSTGRSPGRIDTFVCEDRSLGECSDAARSPGPLHRAALRQVPGLSDDVLSRYDFPGASRVRNYIFYAQLGAGEGDAPHHNAMVFLSLMESGEIEVRVVSAGADGAASPLFGLFRLGRGKP